MSLLVPQALVCKPSGNLNTSQRPGKYWKSEKVVDCGCNWDINSTSWIAQGGSMIDQSSQRIEVAITLGQLSLLLKSSNKWLVISTAFGYETFFFVLPRLV